MTIAVGSRRRPLDANDISLDGQRFLAAVHPEGAQSPAVTFVSNRTAALKK